MTGRIETWKIVLIVILAAGTALRIAGAVSSEIVPDTSDMATYNELALSTGIPVSPPPGYPLFLRAIYSIFGRENYTAAYIVQALISSFTLFLLFLIALEVTGRKTALIAAGIGAFYPNFIFYNMTVLTESLALLFVMLMLLAVVHGRKGREDIPGRKFSVLAAVALFAGCVVRPAFLYFWPGVLAVTRKRLAFLVVTASFVLPVVIFGLATGRGSNRGGLAFYKTYNPRATGVVHYKMSETELKSRDLSSAVYVKEAMKFISENRWQTIDIIYNKGSLIFARGWDEAVMKGMTGGNLQLINILTYSWLPVMVLGFIGLLRFRDGRNVAIALPAVSYIVFIILMAIFKVRYRFLVEPVFIIFASITIGRICGLKECSPPPGQSSVPAAQ